jgi:hypothetical protein
MKVMQIVTHRKLDMPLVRIRLISTNKGIELKNR